MQSRLIQTATILLPIVASCSQQSGRVIQAGSPTPAPTTSAAAVVMPTAERYIGVPYKWGGTTPNGFDCSGYVQYVFAKHGVRLPRTSRAQAFAGSRVPLDFQSLRTGDLIMFAQGGIEGGRSISHVAIYAGNRRIIHSSKSGQGVRYDNLMSNRGQWYRDNAVVARRVGTPTQNRGIMIDLVKELQAKGYKIDFPLDLGDAAPRP